MNIPKQHQEALERHRKQFEGTGIHIFKNITSGELMLPKPSLDEERSIPKGKTFRGDSYFFRLVNEDHMLAHIETIQEGNMQKLILDQPETVTTKGTVEYVVQQTAVQQLSDATHNEENEKKDVLLVEGPLSGLEILD